LSNWLLFWMPTVFSQFAFFLWLRRFNLVPHERKLRGAATGLALSLADGPIYAVAGVTALLRKPLVYVVTAKSSLASADSYRTFRYHLLGISGALLALAASAVLGHDHWPLRAWALFTAGALLFPVVLFSWGRYKTAAGSPIRLPSVPTV